MRGVGRGRADYNEWGEITYREALDITSSYRRIWPQSSYTGHDWDDVLGMYYAKARFYSAEDKRFVAVDPVKGQITEPLSLVAYVYCVDNPLRWVDPLGEEAIAIAITYSGIEYALAASVATVIPVGAILVVAAIGVCVIVGAIAYYSPTHAWDSEGYRAVGTATVGRKKIEHRKIAQHPDRPLFDLTASDGYLDQFTCDEAKKNAHIKKAGTPKPLATGEESASSGPNKNDDKNQNGKKKNDNGKRPSTTKEWTKAAKRLGYRKTSFRSHGKPVYTNGKNFITPDVDSHNGGWWKMAESPRALLSKDSRLGTYDRILHWIGE